MIRQISREEKVWSSELSAWWKIEEGCVQNDWFSLEWTQRYCLICWERRINLGKETDIHFGFISTCWVGDTGVEYFVQQTNQCPKGDGSIKKFNRLMGKNPLLPVPILVLTFALDPSFSWSDISWLSLHFPNLALPYPGRHQLDTHGGIPSGIQEWRAYSPHLWISCYILFLQQSSACWR